MHVAQQLLEQRLLGDHVHEPEGREREPLDHDLHAHVGHVPARVGDHVVDQELQRGVDRVVAVELRVEVAREHLDVARFVDHLRGRVVLGVDPRHGLDDLRGADERALLAVEELAHPEVERLDRELRPLPLVVHAFIGEPSTSVRRCAQVVDGARHLHRDGLDVDLGVPRRGRARSTAAPSPARRAWRAPGRVRS